MKVKIKLPPSGIPDGFLYSLTGLGDENYYMYDFSRLVFILIKKQGEFL